MKHLDQQDFPAAQKLYCKAIESPNFGTTDYIVLRDYALFLRDNLHDEESSNEYLQLYEQKRAQLDGSYLQEFSQDLSLPNPDTDSGYREYINNCYQY